MRDEDLVELDNGIFALGDAVGPRRRNRRGDVLKVETLLANAGDHDLEDGPTGYAGARLEEAIRAYQKRRGLEVDGILEPEGETIAALERELGGRLPGFRAPWPEEADDQLNRVGRGDEPLFRTGRSGPVLHPIRDLPAIPAAAYQSNRRTVDALFRTADDRSLADLLADAIGHDGLDGVAEVRDMLDQIRDRSPARADAMARAVLDRLSNKDAVLFAGGAQPERAPIGVMKRDAGEGRASGVDARDRESSLQVAQADEGDPERSSLERPFTYADDPVRRKEHLDRAERSLRTRIKGWREIGWHQAADNLERYLSGSGEPLKLDRKQARSFAPIRDVEAENRRRFEQESFLARAKKNKEFNNELLSIKDGQQKDLPPEEWDTAYGAAKSVKDIVSGDGGFYAAFGRTHVHSSTADMTARRDGDTIHLSGTVVHHWADPYDFDRNQPESGPPLMMEEHRGAKPFDVVAAWRQHVEGVVRFESGKLVPVEGRPFKWTDVDP